MKKIAILLFSVLIAFTGCYSLQTISIITSSGNSVVSSDFPSPVISSSKAIHSTYTVSTQIHASVKPVSSQSAAVSFESKEIDPVDQKRKEIEKKYDISIYYGDEFTWKYEGITVTALREPSYVLNMLNLLDAELARYPDGFFADFSRKLHIYLITKFTDSYAGLASYENPKYFELYLSTSTDSTTVLHHEMMHMIDFTMQEKEGYAGFANWNSLNPPGFSYTNSNYSTNSYVYGYAPTADQVYFISGYSLKEEFEDRAEIFKVVMSNPELAKFFQLESPLRKKLEYMIREIRRVFPSVQKTGKAEWEIL